MLSIQARQALRLSSTAWTLRNCHPPKDACLRLIRLRSLSLKFKTDVHCLGVKPVKAGTYTQREPVLSRPTAGVPGDGEALAVSDPSRKPYSSTHMGAHCKIEQSCGNYQQRILRFR